MNPLRSPGDPAGEAAVILHWADHLRIWTAPEEGPPPEWLRELRKPIPKEFQKPVRWGKRQFTSIEHYYVCERLKFAFRGAEGLRWGAVFLPGWPRLMEFGGKGAVVGSGFLWFLPPGEEGQPYVIFETAGVPIHGDGPADPFTGIKSRLISKAASRLGVGHEIYLQGSLDTAIQSPNGPESDRALPNRRAEAQPPTEECGNGFPPVESEPAGDPNKPPAYCPNCAEKMKELKGSAKKTGRPYHFWACSDRGCGYKWNYPRESR